MISLLSKDFSMIPLLREYIPALSNDFRIIPSLHEYIVWYLHELERSNHRKLVKQLLDTIHKYKMFILLILSF